MTAVTAAAAVVTTAAVPTDSAADNAIASDTAAATDNVAVVGSVTADLCWLLGRRRRQKIEIFLTPVRRPCRSMVAFWFHSV